MRDITHVTNHEAQIRACLDQEAADARQVRKQNSRSTTCTARWAVQVPGDTQAHARQWLCLWILAATVGLLALLAAAILWAAHAGHEPAPIPAHLTRLLEA